MPKQIIYGNGIDSASIPIYGLPNETVTVTINGAPVSVFLPDVGDGVGCEDLVITCDTPNETVVVEYQLERHIIFAVGAP